MKNVIKSIIFIVILICLLEVSAYFLLPQRNIKKYGLLKIANYEILSEKEESIDAVIIGDSLVYSSTSPMEIWHNYGYTMFDCANAAQLIKDSYKNLQLAVQSQHPKIVFFEANVLYRNPKNKSFFLDIYKTAENSFPIFNYHNNWKKVLFKFLNNDKIFSEENAYKGYKYNRTVKKAKSKNYMKVTKKAKKIPDVNIEYFEKMVKYSIDNNVKLILISTPNMKSWSYAKHLGAQALASKYNIEFIDLNVDNILNINWRKETKDKGDHLNYQGALKVSNFIGKYLQDTGLFKDHRLDPDYELWNESYQIYNQTLKENYNY